MRSSNERTGDRDEYWSWLMHQPTAKDKSLRSCDYDSLPGFSATAICNLCKLPVLVVEAIRHFDGAKPAKYHSAVARKLEVPCYVVRHNGRLEQDKQIGYDRKKATLFEIEQRYVPAGHPDLVTRLASRVMAQRVGSSTGSKDTISTSGRSYVSAEKVKR